VDRLLQQYIGTKGMNFDPHSHPELSYCKSLDEYYRKERKLRTRNIVTALWHAAGQIPAAVYEETGEALDEVLSGILPAILIGLAVVAGTTLVGISAGALVGAIAGVGIGAVPGAVAGGHIGFSAGVWILEWMGLAFLAVYVGKNLHEVTWLLERGFDAAWGHGARDSFCMDTYELIYGGWNDYVPSTSSAMKASKYFARAVAVVIRLVLEGIVLYITARGVAKLPELVAQLKSSRLGPGFAAWVEKNYLRLMNNPRLKRKVSTGATVERPAKVLTDHTTMQEQPRPGAKTNIAKTLDKSYHYTESKWAKSIKEEGLRPGTYATPSGELSPLQAQIELALPPNKAAPEIKIKIDVDGLRKAGYKIPEVTRVSGTVPGSGGRVYQMPGGGYEMKFPYKISPKYLEVIPIK
jgi:hypothetical protein